MSEAAAGPSTSTSAVDKRKADRLARLQSLSLKRNEARKLNHKEVVEEDRRNKLPTNWEAKRRRLEWEEDEDQRKKEAEEQGLDYEKVKLLETPADEAEKMDLRKKKKQNPDVGFSDYAAGTHRQYQRLTKQMKPKPEDYAKEKQKMGDAFYPDVNTLGVTEHKDSDEAVDRMVDDLEKQIEKRGKYSRRRAHDPDADIDYINERNMKFNKKLERFYGKHTTEIKQNLERGTAV